MNSEIAAIIAEMEKNEVLESEPVVEEAIEVSEPVVEEIVEPVVEETIEIPEPVIEDDVLVEDRPPVPVKTYKIGDEVTLKPGATYVNGAAIPTSMKNSKLYIRSIGENKYGISTKMSGRIPGAVKPEFIVDYLEPKEDTSNHYLILVKVENLDIKSRPVENSKTLKTIHFNGLYTIVEEKDGWGHLKIGGWIPLDKVKKLFA